MLYWLLYEQLYPHFFPFPLFRYVTVRTAFASITALFLSLALGPWMIQKLRELQIGQHIRGRAGAAFNTLQRVEVLPQSP